MGVIAAVAPSLATILWEKITAQSFRQHCIEIDLFSNFLFYIITEEKISSFSTLKYLVQYIGNQVIIYIDIVLANNQSAK